MKTKHHVRLARDVTRINRRQSWCLTWMMLAVALLGGEPACAELAPRTPADDAFAEVQEAYNAQDLDKVSRSVQMFSTRFPNDERLPDARFLKGMAEFRDGQPLMARSTWQALINVHPSSAAAVRAIEQLIRMEGDGTAQRMALLKRLQKDFPKHPTTVRLVVQEAESRAAKQQYAAAVQLYREIEPSLSAEQQLRLKEIDALSVAPQLSGGQSAQTPDGQLAQARELEGRGKNVEAGAIYANVWERNRYTPQGHEARFRQGQCLSTQERYADAIVCWTSLTDGQLQGEWSERALLETARTQAFQMDQLDAGKISFERYLKQYPSSPRRWEAEYQLAGVLFSKGAYEKAKAQFEKFLAEHPNAPTADEARNYLDKCDAALKRAAEKPAEKPKPKVAGPVPKPKTDPIVAQAQTLLKQADAARQQNRHADALATYQRIIAGYRVTESFDLAILGAAESCLAMDNPKRAVELLADLPRTKPDSLKVPDALLMLGDIQLDELDDPPAAQAAYQTVVQKYKDSKVIGPARMGLGIALIRQEQWDEAKEILLVEQKARGGPKTDEPPTGLDYLIEACAARKLPTLERPRGIGKIYRQLDAADVYFTSDDDDKALELYKAVIEVKPHSEEACYAWMQIARIFAVSDREEEAIRIYRNFLTTYQNSQWADDALLRLGVVYVRTDRVDEGFDINRLIVARYPRGNCAFRALYNLAAKAKMSGDLNEALQLFNQLIRDYPTSPAMYMATAHRDHLWEMLKKEKKE